MLIKTEYKGCSRLYWQPSTEHYPDEVERSLEQPQAVFTFRGRQFQLEFDGLVDDIVVQNRRRSGPVIGVEHLCQYLPRLRRAQKRLQQGEKVQFATIEGQPWTARLSQSKHGMSVYVLQGGPSGQSATLKADRCNRFYRLTLRTEGQGITHEITARPAKRGKFVTVAEAVTVFKPTPPKRKGLFI